MSTSDHDNDTSVELDEVSDLASGKIDLDCVVDLDGRVGVADAVIRPQLAKLCSFSSESLQKFDSSSADQPKLGPTTE